MVNADLSVDKNFQFFIRFSDCYICVFVTLHLRVQKNIFYNEPLGYERFGNIMQRLMDVMQSFGDIVQRSMDVMQSFGDIVQC